jgi:hypothetical protein
MKRAFISAVVLLALQACHLNRSLFTKRPTEDIDVIQARVSVDADIPQDHWIRSYDVYVSQIPWRNADSNYLSLQFIPRGPRLSKRLGRQDYLDFTGVLGASIKPFCPSQSSIDSGLPFVIYLDYLSADVTGKTLDRAEIHRHR